VSITACMQRPRSHCVLGVRLITKVVGLTQGRPPSTRLPGHAHSHHQLSSLSATPFLLL
jgi:hypothetical protein